MRIDKPVRLRKVIRKDCVNYEAPDRCRVADRVYNVLRFCKINCKRYVKRSKK